MRKQYLALLLAGFLAAGGILWVSTVARPHGGVTPAVKATPTKPPQDSVIAAP